MALQSGGGNPQSDNDNVVQLCKDRYSPMERVAKVPFDEDSGVGRILSASNRAASLLHVGTYIIGPASQRAYATGGGRSKSTMRRRVSRLCLDKVKLF